MSIIRSFILILALTQAALAAMPTYKGSGTFTASGGGCTAPMPTAGAAPVANDILILVVETEDQASSLTTANGFVEVTNSPQGASMTPGSDPGNRITVFWKRAVGSDSSPVTDDSGDHQTCQIHNFGGVKTSGDPWNVTSGGNDSAANDTSAVIPGATTTANDALVVLIQGTSFNGGSSVQCGDPTNGDLANLSERTDNTNSQGLGGGHCMITGEKATAGSYGDTTLTLANTSYKGAMSIALEGATFVPTHPRLKKGCC